MEDKRTVEAMYFSAETVVKYAQKMMEHGLPASLDSLQHWVDSSDSTLIIPHALHEETLKMLLEPKPCEVVAISSTFYNG